MQAQFFVENVNIACALKNVNSKIFSEDNERVCVRGWLRIRGQGRGMVLLDPMHRFPGAYLAPLVFSTDIYLCWTLWHTPVYAEGAEVWKGGTGNADLAQAVQSYPDSPLPQPTLRLRATEPHP